MSMSTASRWHQRLRTLWRTGTHFKPMHPVDPSPLPSELPLAGWESPMLWCVMPVTAPFFALNPKHQCSKQTLTLLT